MILPIAAGRESNPLTNRRLTLNIEALSKLIGSDRFWRRMTLWFVLVAIPILFLGINYPLIDRTETRVAEISREILITGDWTTLHLNFQPYYDKPPLLYWLCAVCFNTFGATELSARLVPALASWCTLVSTVWFASRWFGSMVGLLSGVVLFLSVGFVVLSRFLASDALLALFTSLTAFSGYEAIRLLSYKASLNASQKLLGNFWLVVCGVVCGLGFLSKGPVIGILCGVPFLFALLYLHRSERFPWLSIGWAVLAFACVAFPWIGWVAVHNPQYLSEFFFKHNINRFGGEFHQKPFWFFIPVLLVGGHPWSFMTIPMLTQFFTSNKPEDLRSRPLLYLIVTGLWCVLFFSLSRCKLPTYILPAAAPLSIATAVFLKVVLCDSSPLKLKRFAQSVAPQMATWVTMLGITTYMIISPLGWGTNQEMVLGFAVPVVFLIVVGVVSRFVRNGPHKSWILCGITALGLSIWLSHSVIPSYATQTTCMAICDDGSEWNQPLRENQIITMVEQFPDVPFYLHRNDVFNSDHFEKDWIEARCKEGMPLVLFIPKSAESEFLTFNIANSKKMYSNNRFAVYSLSRDTSQQSSVGAGSVVLSKNIRN